MIFFFFTKQLFELSNRTATLTIEKLSDATLNTDSVVKHCVVRHIVRKSEDEPEAIAQARRYWRRKRRRDAAAPRRGGTANPLTRRAPRSASFCSSKRQLHNTISIVSTSKQTFRYMNYRTASWKCVSDVSSVFHCWQSRFVHNRFSAPSRTSIDADDLFRTINSLSRSIGR